MQDIKGTVENLGLYIAAVIIGNNQFWTYNSPGYIRNFIEKKSFSTPEMCYQSTAYWSWYLFEVSLVGLYLQGFEITIKCQIHISSANYSSL